MIASNFVARAFLSALSANIVQGAPQLPQQFAGDIAQPATPIGAVYKPDAAPVQTVQIKMARTSNGSIAPYVLGYMALRQRPPALSSPPLTSPHVASPAEQSAAVAEVLSDLASIRDYAAGKSVMMETALAQIKANQEKVSAYEASGDDRLFYYQDANGQAAARAAKSPGTDFPIIQAVSREKLSKTSALH